MMRHVEVNRRARQLFCSLPMQEAEARIKTLYQLASIGLDMPVIDHLLMAVPVRARSK